MMRQPTLFLTVGLPCTGKTTAARRIEIEQKALRLTKDEWVKALYGHENPRSAQDVIEGRLIQIGLRALELGNNVVVDYGLWGRNGKCDLHHISRGWRSAADSHGLSRTHTDDGYLRRAHATGLRRCARGYKVDATRARTLPTVAGWQPRSPADHMAPLGATTSIRPGRWGHEPLGDPPSQLRSQARHLPSAGTPSFALKLPEQRKACWLRDLDRNSLCRPLTPMRRSG
jgi:hypothetical protein